MKPGVFPTEDGQSVYIGQSGIDHMLAHPMPDELIEEAIWKSTLTHSRSVCQIDIGRIVGHDGKITTDPTAVDAPALFARRLNRSRPSRCVRTLGAETSFITMITRKSERFSSYYFISAWVGSPAHKEPRNIRDQSAIEFWGNHALAWNPEVFIEEPFESTWEEVLSLKWPKNEQCSLLAKV
jgi:hypothetical protein